jgi:hypothetical protein
MATLEERVAYLEGRGEEHAAAIAEVRADVRDVRTELRDFRVEVNRRFDQMDSRFDTKFTWMIGFQFATLMSVIAALLNVYFC